MLNVIAGLNALIGVILLLFAIGSALRKIRQNGPVRSWRIIELIGFSAATLSLAAALAVLASPVMAPLYYGSLLSGIAAIIAALQFE